MEINRNGKGGRKKSSYWTRAMAWLQQLAPDVTMKLLVKEKGTLCWRTFSNDKWTENERTTHDGRSFRIRRPPLRFSAGAPGEKTRGK